DDRVRRRVEVWPSFEAGRVSDDVVLLAALGVLVEQSQADRLVVDRRGCGGWLFQLERWQFIDDGGRAVFHAVPFLYAAYSHPPAAPGESAWPDTTASAAAARLELSGIHQQTRR